MPLIIDIKVVPSAGRALCKLDKNGQLKCYVKSPPEQGKANKELIKLLAKALKIPQADVTIIAGATRRNKKIQITYNITLGQLLDALGIERQMRIL